MLSYCMERRKAQLSNKSFYKNPALFVQKQIKEEKINEKGNMLTRTTVIRHFCKQNDFNKSQLLSIFRNRSKL